MERMFAGYHLVAQLGAGGMGAAYVAEKRGPGGVTVRVCLKRMHPGILDAAAARSFQHEARLAGMLSHHGIVKVHAIGEEDGQWWMAMELVEGTDLGRLLEVVHRRGERLSTQLVAWIGSEVAEALAWAHELTLSDGTPAGVVHRDVKPPNVLLAKDGRVKLTDFGIAKSALGERTQTGWMKGTIAYMSPEQVQQRRDLDHRSDLFSLGVMLFEMTAGVRPFDGENDMQTMLNVADRRLTAKLPPTTPPQLRLTITTLLALERDDRPSSGVDVANALLALTSPSRARRELEQRVAEIRSSGAEPADSTEPTIQGPPPGEE